MRWRRSLAATSIALAIITVRTSVARAEDAADVARSPTGGASSVPNGRDTSTSTRTSTATQGAASGGALTLAQLGQLALANNLRVHIDEAQIGEARALYELAAAQAMPRFSMTALFGGPTPERRTTVLNRPDQVTPPTLEGDLDFGSLGVTFRLNGEGALPLYTFGKISNGKAAATALVRAAEEKKHITEGEVLVQVSNAFWAFQLTRSFVTSLEDGEKTLEKVLKKIEDLLESESPQVTENDRLRLMHALATLRVRKAEATNANDLAKAALKLLVGKSQDDAIEIAFADLEELPAKIPAIEDYAREAQLARPELRALRHVIEAHARYADLRESGFWPDLFVGAILRYAYTSNATDQTSPFVYDDYNFIDVGVGLGLRMELDVFTKIAQLEQANAAKRTREAETAAAAQAIDLEVRKIHADLENGYQRISLLERANRAARGWLTASTLAYDIGAGNAGELIDAFLAWAQSEGELQKTRYDMQLAHTDYARAAGQLVGRAGSAVPNATTNPPAPER